MKSNIKIIIYTILIAILIIAIIVGTRIVGKLYNTFEFYDTPVSITTSYKFRQFDDDNKMTNLSLYSDEYGLSVTSRALPLSFWESGDMLAVCDEYLGLMSSKLYDRSITDISMEKIIIDGVEVGKASLTAGMEHTFTRTVTLLFPKECNNLIIEIFGDEDKVKTYQDEINKLINGIKINKKAS